jgi:hypothetical protein
VLGCPSVRLSTARIGGNLGYSWSNPTEWPIVHRSLWVAAVNIHEAVALSVLSSLVRPMIFVPAIALGWFARRWWQVVAAAILIALAWFAFMLLKGLPPGAKVAWAATPLMVVAPLAWCSVGFLLRRHSYARATPVGKLRFRRVIYVLLGFVLGGVIGGVAGFAIGSAYVTAAQVSSFEGLSGYVVVYAFAFPGAIIGMVAGVIMAWLVARRSVAT